MELVVDAEVLDVTTGNRELTNTFYITFHSDRTVPTVVPYSYSEGMIYLEARRRFDRFLSQHRKMAE
ncbi:unnamed protein product [Litomosoides sigmodontis]|uniref:Uncharacterized protein n=1 Tax=Litomosoides sigmodontis TaxID=42156 RepID=A0A3P6UD79_LITSI|nr:unnamed protein product [Litomosoides sigmodontis]